VSISSGYGLFQRVGCTTSQYHLKLTHRFEDWIITATSSPFENSPDALVEDILNQLSKQAEYGGSHALPVSATELVPVIIDHCIGSYEKKPNESNRISIGQTFSHYINSIVRRHIHTLHW
jgi:tRNA G10  N-methylase Trm11